MSNPGEHPGKAAPPKDEPPIDIDDTDSDDESKNGDLRCAPPQDQQNPQPPEAEAGQSGTGDQPPEDVDQPGSSSAADQPEPEQLIASARPPLIEISPSNVQNRDIERDRSPLGKSKPDSDKEPSDMDNRPPRQRNNRRRRGFRNGMDRDHEEQLAGRAVEPAANVAQPIHIEVGALLPVIQAGAGGGAEGENQDQGNQDEELDNAENEQNEAQEQEEEQEPEPDAADREVQGLLQQAGAPGLRRGRPRVRRNSNERNDNEGDNNRNNGDDAPVAMNVDNDDNQANANEEEELPDPPRIRDMPNPNNEEQDIHDMFQEVIDQIDREDDDNDVVPHAHTNGLGPRVRRDAYRENNPDFMMVMGQRGGFCAPCQNERMLEESCFKDEGDNLNFLLQESEYFNGDVKKLAEALQDTLFEQEKSNSEAASDDETEQLPAVYLRDDSFETLMGLSPNKDPFSFTDAIVYSASINTIRETNLMFLYLLRSEAKKIEEKKFKLLPEQDHTFDYPEIIDTFQLYMEGFSASHLRRTAFSLGSSVDLTNLSYYGFIDNISSVFKRQGLQSHERVLFVMFTASDILLRALNNQEITYFYRLYHWITIFLSDLVSNWGASHAGWENIFCRPLVGENSISKVAAMKQLLFSVGITLGFATIATMLFYKFRN